VNIGDQIALDEIISNGLKHLSVDDFSHLLDTVYEALESMRFPPTQCVRLMHAATVLLHDTPQGKRDSFGLFLSTSLTPS